MVGVLSSCVLLGGFAIGARVSLLRQQSAEREMSVSARTLSLCLVVVLLLHVYWSLIPLLMSRLHDTERIAKLI